MAINDNKSTATSTPTHERESMIWARRLVIHPHLPASFPNNVLVLATLRPSFAPPTVAADRSGGNGPGNLAQGGRPDDRLLTSSPLDAQQLF